MKTLNQFILERLKLDKDSKLNYDFIPTKFSNYRKDWGKKEIGILQKFAKQLKVKPIIMSNYYLIKGERWPYDSDIIINLYYDKEWQTNNDISYISFHYNPISDWVHKVSAGWRVYVHINGKQIWDSGTKPYGTYDKNHLEESLKDVCEELLEYLDENPEFYNEVKK